MKTLIIGQQVKVSCPVYKNGKKHTGVITELNSIQAKVKIDGNSKSTIFALAWIKALSIITLLFCSYNSLITF